MRDEVTLMLGFLGFFVCLLESFSDYLVCIRLDVLDEGDSGGPGARQRSDGNNEKELRKTQ